MGKLIAIDAGHGMGTAGKRCLRSIDANQTREWFLNDRIADCLKELLTAYDCTTLRVDDTTGVKDIPLSIRVATANEAKADIYISIHHNAGINGGAGGGIVVYYYSSTTERRKQAEVLYNTMVAHSGLRGNRSQPIQKNGLYVLKHTTMPAFLAENGFMDSIHDTPIIITADHARKTAKAIKEFIVGQLQLKLKTDQEKPNTEPETKPYIYYPACAKKYTTLAAALTSVNVNSTYAFRKKIAAENNITCYCGTAAQNTRMLNLLKAGILKIA